MKLNKLFLFAACGLILSIQAKAQLPEGFKAEVEIQATGTTNKVVPFWMRSNQYGSVPLSGASGSLLGRISKDYESNNNQGNKKLVDWGFGFEGRANGGKGSNLTIIEGYLKGRLGIFQLKGGRSKDVMGLNGDTLLSSGNFAVSGNALGIPKIELSIPEYYTLPVLGDLFAIKGNFTHGWLGGERIRNTINGVDGVVLYRIENTNPKTYLHQKSLYVKFGKESWKLNLYGGFNHQVFWGNEEKIYNGNFKLSPLESFFYVATGKTYGASGVPRSKIGNQLGSIDLGLDYKFNSFSMMIYRQNFYDVGALSKLANIADGLNGISITNTSSNAGSNSFIWKKILLELFYSKNQAGYPWSTPTKSGDEDYYNNFFYVNGWSYNGTPIGNPLITARKDAKPGQATSPFDYFVNNRVIALNAGLSGEFKKWTFNTKITYSMNYGTFGTSPYGNSTGVIRNPQTTNLFKEVKQFSFYLDATKEIQNDFKVGFIAAVDQGKLLNNSSGISVKVIKSFN